MKLIWRESKSSRSKAPSAWATTIGEIEICLYQCVFTNRWKVTCIKADIRSEDIGHETEECAKIYAVKMVQRKIAEWHNTLQEVRFE